MGESYWNGRVHGDRMHNLSLSDNRLIKGPNKVLLHPSIIIKSKGFCVYTEDISSSSKIIGIEANGSFRFRHWMPIWDLNSNFTS